MERGSINGIPCWIKVLGYTGGERTVVKEAPGVDGAVVEVQGQHPGRFRVQFELIRDGEWIVDDYEVATLDLRSMLLAGGPFVVDMPMFGEVDGLWLAGTYTLDFFDHERRAISGGSFDLVQASPSIVLADNPAAVVESAITDLSKFATEDFARRKPPTGLRTPALTTLGAGLDLAERIQGLINAAFGPVNAFSAALQSLRGNLQRLLNAPKNFAARLQATFAGLLSLVPGLSKDTDSSTSSAAVGDLANDKPTNVLVGALLDGAAFDSDVGPTQADLLGEAASDDDLAERDELLAAKQLVLVSLTSSVCLAATRTHFATVQSVLTLAETLGPVFDGLLELEDIDYQVYNSSRYLWKATLAFLAAEAAKLPRLVMTTIEQDTDVLSILPDLYESLGSEEDVELAVESLCALNSIADPTTLLRGTTLRYLDPLTS